MVKTMLAGSVALVSLAVAVSPAAAQSRKAQPAAPTYSAEDVVKTFAPNQGGSRGLCIGTETECKLKAAAAPQVAPKMDLLITFEYGSDDLTAPAKQNLDQFARALLDPALSKKHFVVEGHTDGQGTEAYNQELSERRAATVVKYLSDKGVDQATLLSRGFGKSKPRVADVMDPQNRRVEARLAD